MGACANIVTNAEAAKSKDFAPDQVVCFALVNMMVYSFFLYSTRAVADCSFNPMICMVKMIKGKFDIITVTPPFPLSAP